MKELKRISAIIGLALLSAFLALPAGAAQINANLQPIAGTLGLGTTDIRVIVGNVIYAGLGLLGTILLVIIIYAGFLWMTSGGDDEKITQAKKLILNGVIGLAIVLASYAITYFVVTRLMGIRDSNGTGGPGTEQAVTSGFGDYGSGSLGEGIIQSNYPSPGATNVARNTKIIVTFKLPLDPTTIIANGAQKDRGDGKGSVYTGTINLANARLIASTDLATGGAFQTSADKLISDINAYTVDNKTFVFAPAKYLGSPSQNVSYTMALGPGIKLADTKSLAFTGNFSMGYHWEFETGTTIDSTPPHIISVSPSPPGGTFDKNVTISITFSEAVDPTSATGIYTADNLSFSNVTVETPTSRVQGTWEPSNQYRTIGFHSNVKGGTNSCGDDVYVLPGGTLIKVTALAASVGDAPPTAKFYPPDGITDLASNSLDGNNNGTAEGQPKDTVAWNFNTTNILNLTSPHIALTDPAPESVFADLSKPVTMTFDKQMSIPTLTNQNLVFDTSPKIPLWYFGEALDLGVDGAPVTDMNQKVARTQALIDHERLAPTVGKCSDGVRKNDNCAVDADCPAAVCTKTVFNYYPKATSGVTDIYQNCFLPACGDDPTRRYCCPSAGANVSCRTECTVSAASGQLYCDESKP